MTEGATTARPHGRDVDVATRYPSFHTVMVTPFDVFFWRSLIMATLIAALAIPAGLSWLVARIRARSRLHRTRLLRGGANARIAG